MLSNLVLNARSWLTQVFYRPPTRDQADASRTLEEVITSRGFKPETHEVTTNDGYILTIHRLVNPTMKHEDQDNPCQGYPVLLMHGFGGNASNFLVGSDDGYLDDQDIQELESRLRGDENCDANSNTAIGRSKEFDNNLAFCLSKKGYDVWCANQRGSKHSRKHRTLATDSDSYWDFSLDELVEHDLPTIIEHILKTNGSSNY